MSKAKILKRRGPKKSLHTEAILVRFTPESRQLIERIAEQEEMALGVVVRRLAEKQLRSQVEAA